MTIVATFGFMLSINVKITFVVVVITPLSIFVANFIAKRTFAMFRRTVRGAGNTHVTRGRDGRQSEGC